MHIDTTAYRFEKMTVVGSSKRDIKKEEKKIVLKKTNQ